MKSEQRDCLRSVKFIGFGRELLNRVNSKLVFSACLFKKRVPAEYWRKIEPKDSTDSVECSFECKTKMMQKAILR